MIAIIGYVAILVALGGSAALAIRAGASFLNGSALAPARIPTRAVLGGAAIAFAALVLGLLTDDFSIGYIADNHSTATPFVFTIATAWAALEGSILLWGLVLAGFVYGVYRTVADGDRLGVGALSVLGVIGVFFFGVMATIANPFAVCTELIGGVCAETSWHPFVTTVAPLDGPGPNPLLQNHILMAVHPPVLYVGYVGFAVPFAFAISTLAGGSATDWLERTRRWTLFAWVFLTAGISLGALWSYAVLGWGGYWAWDPVENASFLPWLAGTAFIHSAVVERRRGMLRSWNILLVIATFALTILGTFLTRSGVVASVHSFTQSAIGPALLGFLLFVLVVSLGLFASRAHLIAQSPRLESLASREGVFLANNLLLTLFTVVVLVGTLGPLFLEAFTDRVVTVGRPFFDQLAAPISYLLLLAIGLGPITPYRTARPEVVWERIRTPLRVALAAGAAAVLLGRREATVLVVLMLAVFITAVIGRHLIVQARKTGEGFLGGVRRVVGREPAYWGGQIAHIGVAVLALGITVSAALAVQDSITLRPGETEEFAGFELTYVAPFQRQTANRTELGATVQLSRDGRVIDTLEPRLNTYPNQVQPIATPAIHTDLSGDVYLSLTRINETAIGLDLWRYPLEYLIWLGGFIIVAGGVWSLTMRKRARSRPLTEAAAP
ncbi:MAG: heme lyase CcmF/NrfE family subunit [Acidimicrobiia bacterium]|nr:heme lyase CcmF/NrfE family subunit [Acidimicrobiia bacterium]